MKSIEDWDSLDMLAYRADEGSSRDLGLAK